MKKQMLPTYKKQECDRINEDVGFTGTRDGMTPRQANKFREIIKEMNIRSFHHGDCIGSDLEAHKIIRKLKPKAQIYVHPPIKKRYRAFCKGDFTAPEKDYLARDFNIVNGTETLLATPKQKSEVLRSGTWTTIRYAKKMMRKITIIYPDGTSINGKD